MTNGNIIECVKRTYRVKIPGKGSVIVESRNVLSAETTKALLNDDLEINRFFNGNCTIVDISTDQSNLLPTEERPVKQSVSGIHAKQSIGIPLLSPEEIMAKEHIKKTNNTSDDMIVSTPINRLNQMIKIKGEFTAAQYKKLLENVKCDITKYITYDDIERALILKRIKQTEKRTLRKAIIYKVIDDNPIDEYTYLNTMKEYNAMKEHEGKMVSG